MRTAAHESSDGVRTVGGASSATASIFWGSADFTVTKTATGTYAVRFLRPFRVLKSITVNFAQGTAGYAASGGMGPEGFTAFLYNSAGVLADGPFSFLAAGR